MASKPKKIFLFHGDCDYLIYKELKDIKKKLQSDNTSIAEFDGTKELSFDSINMALASSDLFLNSNAVFIRDISGARSLFPFVEELTQFIEKEELENELYIFNFGKIAKTTKIYKAIEKKGGIKEIKQPSEAEILNVIKKSIQITDDAARLLMEYSKSDLFQIRNEIKKLSSYISSESKTKVDVIDVEKLAIKSISQNDVWGIGSLYLKCKINKDNRQKKILIDTVEELLSNNIPVMQIIYSFYQNILSAIKLKHGINSGQIKNNRDAFSVGYFFVKDFYSQKDKLDLDYLFKTNSEILEVEFLIKSGEFNEVSGLRKLVVSA